MDLVITEQRAGDLDESHVVTEATKILCIEQDGSLRHGDFAAVRVVAPATVSIGAVR